MKCPGVLMQGCTGSPARPVVATYCEDGDTLEWFDARTGDPVDATDVYDCAPPHLPLRFRAIAVNWVGQSVTHPNETFLFDQTPANVEHAVQLADGRYRWDITGPRTCGAGSPNFDLDVLSPTDIAYGPSSITTAGQGAGGIYVYWEFEGEVVRWVTGPSLVYATIGQVFWSQVFPSGRRLQLTFIGGTNNQLRLEESATFCGRTSAVRANFWMETRNYGPNDDTIVRVEVL